LPEVIALIKALPGTDRELQPVSGHTLLWTQQKLSQLLNRGVITRLHGVYSHVGNYEPSYTLQILDAMRTFGPLSRKDVALLGVNERSACGILTDLERRGLIQCDSSVRPFRYGVPS
jgi:hypothetical protein